MNYEKQILKQTSEQPAYVTSEHMLRMLRSSMIRYERSSNTSSLLPLFFSYTNELIKESDKIMSEIAPIQQVYVQMKNDAELSQMMAGLARTVRCLPVLMKQVPQVSVCNRATLIPCRTSYDLCYYYFPEAAQTSNYAENLAQKLSTIYGSHLIVKPHLTGALIIDPTNEKEISLEKPCEYVPYDQSIEVPPVSMIETPETNTIQKLAEFTGKTEQDLVKAVMLEVEGRLVFINIRGDLEVSKEKLRHVLGINESNVEINLASEELITKHGLVPGFTGLIGIKRAGECTIIVDESVKTVAAGVTGANKKDYHYINFNLARDTKKISKFIKYADVAENTEQAQGAIVAEVADCVGFYPDMLGLDNKHVFTPLFKITIRLIDLVASTLGVSRKIKGCYIINMCKDDEKLNATVSELLKVLPIECIVVDNRPKANFGQKKQIAEISLFQHVIVVSTKLEADSISVDENPIPIAELSNLFN